MEQFLFVLYALCACGGALAVVLSQNVVRMAFYLVISLGSTAGLFFLLNADFVGATQLLIYVGGTVVLLIFGVMLTASAPFTSIQSTPAEILQGAIVGIAFLALLISTVLAVNWDETNHALAAYGDRDGRQAAENGFNPIGEGNSARPIGTALLGVRFDKDLEREAVAAESAAELHAHTHGGESHTHQHAAGAGHAHGEHEHGGGSVGPRDAKASKLSTGYLLPFEIVSVHLLVVLVGAAYLARAKRSQPTASASRT